MALANVSYTADGTTVDYVITFAYLDRSHVSVFVDNVETTDAASLYTASFQDDTTIRVTAVSDGSAVPLDSVVRINRITPLTTATTVFSDGSVVRASALNANTNQLLYVAQEVQDNDVSRIGLDNDDKWAGQGYALKDLADPSSDQDAVTVAFLNASYNSGVDAGQARTDALAAQAASEAARDAAVVAQGAAETAETNAETAETNAQTAETNAASSASAAATSSSEAQGFRDTAETHKDAASTSATNAAGSAAAASTSEGNAAASESAAATSESNSATSESNASASAAASASSASAAATSEGNASTSESNAAASAATATTKASEAATSASDAASDATDADNARALAIAAQGAAESARDATLAAYDSFDDRYLGVFATDPTVDNDGNALVAGTLYFDSTNGIMKIHTGSDWVAAYVSGTDFAQLAGAEFTGDVGIGITPAYELHVDGDIYATGNVTAFSSGAAKANVQTLDDALDVVEQLRGVSYNWKHSGEKAIGFIYEEVKQVIPELTSSKGGAVGVAYQNTTALLVEAVKALSKRVKELEGDK